MTRTEIERIYAKLDVYETIEDYLKNVIQLADKRNQLSNEEYVDYYKHYAETQDATNLIAYSSELTGNVLSSFIMWLYGEITTEIGNLGKQLPDVLSIESQTSDSEVSHEK